MDEIFYHSSIRFLGLVNLNPASSLYGSADRSFWHYHDLKNFEVGSFFVGMFGLKVAALKFQNEAFEKASDAVLQRWSDQIIEKRMLDEYFPEQKSFCATAYTSMAAALSLKIDIIQQRETTSTARNALKIALEALSSDHHRPVSANQSLAARLAYDIAIELKIFIGPNPFNLTTIKDSNFPSEYGGIDLGYGFKCVDICTLALIFLEDREQRKFYQPVLESYLAFLNQVSKYGFHPILGSRGNPHGLLGGLTLLSQYSIHAKKILEAFEVQRVVPELVRAQNCDDKYLSFFHLTSLTIKNLPAEWVRNLEEVKIGEQLIPNILFHRNETGSLVLAEQNGHYLISRYNERKVFSGYLYKVKGEYFVPAEKSTIQRDNDKITITHFSCKMKEKNQLTQNFTTATSIKLLLKNPLTSSLFRNYIYDQTQKQRNSNPYLRTIIDLQKLEVQIEWLVKVDKSWDAQGWNFVDGHATRMHGMPVTFFSPL